jgi:inosine-uridine nucleoside N-ribohydrolase
MVKIILDTDISPDYDDVGAMAVLHALAKRGEAEILATATCNAFPYALTSIRVINAFYGRDDIPTGVVRPDGVSMDDGMHNKKWPIFLFEKYGKPEYLKAEPAVRLYRHLLAAADDASVTIVTIGWLTNLADLLASGPDEFSPLDGRALVARKVGKLVSMAGKFPAGREFNVFMDTLASKKVYANWPTPILFSGFEIGINVLTGTKLIARSGEGNPVKDAYAIALPQGNPDGRPSWDHTTVLAAVRGPGDYFDVERGRIEIYDDGSNGWQPDPEGPHARLLPKMPWAELAELIEALMAPN